MWAVKTLLLLLNIFIHCTRQNTAFQVAEIKTDIEAFEGEEVDDSTKHNEVLVEMETKVIKNGYFIDCYAEKD